MDLDAEEVTKKAKLDKDPLDELALVLHKGGEKPKKGEPAITFKALAPPIAV